MTTSDRTSIAVIGAGFSGLMVAIHLLLKSGRDGPRIYLIEQSETFGLGAAYATDSGRHLLNTRASGMSVFPDRPRHFVEWLETHPGYDRASGTSFISRRTYGEYLQSLLREAACGEQAAGRLYLVPDEAVSLEPKNSAIRNGAFALGLKVGKVLCVDAVILATGNAPPHPPDVPEAAFFSSSRYIEDPWERGAFDGIGADDTVLMLGTGLTMVDVALLLKSRGAEGPLIAISRRGQVPRSHAAPTPAPAIAIPTLPTKLSEALRTLRRVIADAEQQGGSWHHVMDAIRPLNSAYWQSLPHEARRRFLRHLRPWWDVHRHRLAPKAASRLEALKAQGQLAIRRARLARFALNSPGSDYPVTVHWRASSGAAVETFGVHHVVNCMGPGGDPTRSHSPVIRNMLAAGLTRPDSLRLGIEVDADGRVVSAEGAVAERLFALGPPTRGIFWESTAVPDIREHAHRLAETALASLDIASARARAKA
jgi:uncharacterized NAD(P)/FAD-binding protein YdhS